MVELDVQAPALGVDPNRLIETALALAQIVQQAKSAAGEVAEFGMMTLGLKFGDHHDR
ncbi:hypothetical protein SDC9_139385 [bioreactor metagenome]|uniref:Uncharacterized protein n=1 Tax=bioreactor metagenome TaxID=1076179 RepID=A0A645DRZ5_9ZZZZ